MKASGQLSVIVSMMAGEYSFHYVQLWGKVRMDISGKEISERWKHLWSEITCSMILSYKEITVQTGGLFFP